MSFIREALECAPRCGRCGHLVVPVPSPFWQRTWMHWPYPRRHVADLAPGRELGQRDE